MKHVSVVEKRGYVVVEPKNLALRGEGHNVFDCVFEVLLVGQRDLALLKGEDKLDMLVQEQDWWFCFSHDDAYKMRLKVRMQEDYVHYYEDRKAKMAEEQYKNDWEVRVLKEHQ